MSAPIDFTLLGEIAEQGRIVNAAMTKANGAWDRLTAFTRDNKATIDQLRQLEKELADAQKALALARNDALEKIGWKVPAEKKDAAP